MEKRLSGVTETAEAWDVSKDTVWRAIKRKDVRSVRIGRRVLIPIEEVERVCESGFGRTLQPNSLDHARPFPKQRIDQ